MLGEEMSFAEVIHQQKVNRKALETMHLLLVSFTCLYK